MASTPNNSNQPVPKPKQKHVTTACLNCRNRKIKCDAVTPSCSNCVLYSQKCVYQHGVDKRKIPIKERLLAVEAYAKELETLLIENGIPLPGEQRSLSPPTTGLETPILPSASRKNSKPPIASNLDLAKPNTSFHSPPAEGSSPLVDQLTGSLGSLQLAEDGQLRFYGATSNLHLLVAGARSSNVAKSLADPMAIQSTLDAAGVGHYVDPELEDHLIKLYFCWEDPSIHLVQEDVFYRERQYCKANMEPSKLYSEVLVNSMCAVGASLTSRHCVELPESLVDFFSARARALLDVELDSPTLSTVQSLGILSGVESISTRDARGWLYSGMAVRLALDLGLHLDNEVYVDAGILSPEEATLRRVVFWGAFIHERMWSLYLGRPVSLDEAAITISPYVATTTEPKYWQPYVDEYEDFEYPPLLDPIEELNRHNATLCAKMTRIRESLYSDAIVSTLGAQQLHDFASSMRAELLEWQRSLPECLNVDLTSVTTFCVPHVLQLHMQYHTCMILVNRPFFAASIATLPDVAFSDPMVGRPACTDSARAISRLLQIYRRLYSFRRINIQVVHLIFTASLVHVLNACEAVEPSLRNSAWKDLEVCQQALSELSKGYKSATRALRVIHGIKNELLKATRESAKRSAAITPGNELEDGGGKRSRSDEWQDDFNASNAARDDQNEDIILNPAMNVIDSIFWSELTSLDFPRF